MNEGMPKKPVEETPSEIEGVAEGIPANPGEILESIAELLSALYANNIAYNGETNRTIAALAAAEANLQHLALVHQEQGPEFVNYVNNFRTLVADESFWQSVANSQGSTKRAHDIKEKFTILLHALEEYQLHTFNFTGQKQ